MAPNKGLTKRQEVSPLPPNKDPKVGYWWCFGEKAPPDKDQQARQEAKVKRAAAARRRKEGFEWLFGE
jgi:hypothetical protein